MRPEPPNWSRRKVRSATERFSTIVDEGEIIEQFHSIQSTGVVKGIRHWLNVAVDEPFR